MKRLPTIRSLLRAIAGILLVLTVAGCVEPDSSGAVYVPRYALTYDGNGATGGSVPIDPDSPHLTGDIVMIEMNTTLARTGYSFEGWSTDPNAIDEFWPVDSPLPQLEIGESDVVLFAVWSLVYAVGDTGPRVALSFTTREAAPAVGGLWKLRRRTAATE